LREKERRKKTKKVLNVINNVMVRERKITVVPITI